MQDNSSASWIKSFVHDALTQIVTSQEGRSFAARWDTLVWHVSGTVWQCHPSCSSLSQTWTHEWKQRRRHTSDKTWDVIGPICLRGPFSVLNINIPSCIKAQHYSRTIMSTTTKTIQPKRGQEQITLPLLGNYVTVFCLCSQNLDKVFTLAKQTHFCRKSTCTTGLAILYERLETP